MIKNNLENLVISAKKGNADSFAKLYSYFAQNIYYFALRITKNEHDANDVVQDTMLSLYENLPKLKNPKSIVSFVNSTTHNFAISLIRKRRDYYPDDDNFFENNLDETDEDFIPESYIEEKERRQEIINILDQLPESRRIAIMMYYFEGLSTVEIAKILGTTEETIRARLSRGRNSIKKAIQAQGTKGAVATLMSVSVLSKILDIEAQASFSTANHTANWLKIGETIGYNSGSVQHAVRYAVINKTPQLATALTQTATVISVKSIIATTLAIGTVATSGVVITKSVIKTPDVFAKTSQPVQNNISENIKIKILNSDDNSSGIIEVEEVSVPIYSNDFNVEEVLTADQQPKTEVEAEKLSPDETINTALVPPTNVELIKRNNYLPIKYPLGSKVSLQQIINDSEISVLENAKVEVMRFDLLDTSKKGDYMISFRATVLPDSAAYETIVVVIIE